MAFFQQPLTVWLSVVLVAAHAAHSQQECHRGLSDGSALVQLIATSSAAKDGKAASVQPQTQTEAPSSALGPLPLAASKGTEGPLPASKSPEPNAESALQHSPLAADHPPPPVPQNTGKQEEPSGDQGHAASEATTQPTLRAVALAAPRQPANASGQPAAGQDAPRQGMGDAVSAGPQPVPKRRPMYMWLMFLVGLTVPAVVYVLFRLTGYLGARCVGRAIEVAIEKYDTAALGVEVDIGKLLVNPCAGSVAITGLTIDNPQGYKSDYLLAAKTIEIDFGMTSLLFSNFRHVVVEKIVLRRVDIIYEKGWSSSNVQDILSLLEGKLERWAKWLEERKQQQHVRKKTKADKASKVNLEEERTLVEVREVLVEDVGVRLQGQMLGGHGARLALADIKYDNLTKIAGAAYTDDVLKLILKSIMKTVAANVVGKYAGDKCAKTAERCF